MIHAPRRHRMSRHGSLVLGLAAIGLIVALPSDVVHADDTASSSDQDAMMAMMQDAMKAASSLGEHHEALATFVGDWDVEIALVMPGMPAQTSAGTATYSWLIPGRWLGQHVTGTMMGMPYQGFSIHGFDGYAKNHVVASMNSMDTALIVARGVVVDPTGKTTAAYGTLDEYTTGELGKPIKVVTKVKDADHHVIEVWDLGIGESGAKVLEFRYKRKKG